MVVTLTVYTLPLRSAGVRPTRVSGRFWMLSQHWTTLDDAESRAGHMVMQTEGEPKVEAP